MKMIRPTQTTMRYLSANLVIVLSISLTIFGCSKEEVKDPETPVYDNSVNVDLPEGFSPVSSTAGSGVTDVDGNSYSSVVLGNGQEWMAQNLKTSKFSNGDAIAYYGGEITTITIINPGANYADGTYNGIPFVGGSGTGGTGDFTVTGGKVVSVTVANAGSAYSVNDLLDVNDTLLSDTSVAVGSNLALKPATTWGTMSTPAWTQYDFDSQNETDYGKLYNYYTVADARNVCPTGWHVPTDADWDALTLYLDPDADTSIVEGQGNFNSQSAYGGGRIKSKSNLWLDPNYYATDEVNYSALPGGAADSLGTFDNIQEAASFWSATAVNANDAYTRGVSYGSGRLRKYMADQNQGTSIRCIKD